MSIVSEHIRKRYLMYIGGDSDLNYTVMADVIGALLSIGFNDVRISKHEDEDADTYSVMARGITSADTRNKIEELRWIVNRPGLAVPIALSKSFRIEIYADDKTQITMYEQGWQILQYHLPDYAESGVYIRLALDLSELQSGSGNGDKQ